MHLLLQLIQQDQKFPDSRKSCWTDRKLSDKGFLIDWEVSGCAAKFLIMAKDSSSLGFFQKLWKFSGLSRKYFIRKKGWDSCKKIGTKNILQDSRLCKQFLGVFGLERVSTKALFPLCGESRAIYVHTIVHGLEQKISRENLLTGMFHVLGLFLFSTSHPEVKLCNPKNPSSFQFTLVCLSVQPARSCHSGQEPSK